MIDRVYTSRYRFNKKHEVYARKGAKLVLIKIETSTEKGGGLPVVNSES
jgi:hypothetical protein